MTLFFSNSALIKQEEKKIINIVNKVLKSGNFILGLEVKKFEKNFSKYIGCKYGIGVGNCTDAIFICLKALNIGEGDEVITVSNTAIPTVLSIVNSGATPKFVDIGDDHLIDVKKIENLITNKTKAIIPVHLYGQPCNLKEILKIAKKFNLKIIEDCAQSTGASIGNKKTGSFGDFGCFSFYPTKILPSLGDGGFITTNNKVLYNKIKNLRYMGIETNKNSKHKLKNSYFAYSYGINSRLDEIHAAILNFRLKKINNYIKTRRLNARLYSKLLNKTNLILPRKINKVKDVFYEFVVVSKNRKKIINNLKKNNIYLKITYPFPIYKMPPYKKFFIKKNLSNTEKMSKKIFSLPIYPGIKQREIKTICEKILNLC